MSDSKYKEIDSIETRVIEECSEVIFAICKAQRFGWDNCHPTIHQEGKNNTLDVIKEIDDLIKVAIKLKSNLIDKLQRQAEEKRSKKESSVFLFDGNRG